MAMIWKQCMDKIIEPDSRVTKTEFYRQSRLLNILIIAFLLLTFLFLFLSAFHPDLSFFQNPDVYIALAAAVLFICTYVTNRLGYYHIASIMIVVTISIAVFATTLSTMMSVRTLYDPHDVNIFLFLFVPVFVAQILLSLRAMLITTAVNTLIMLIMPLFFQFLSFVEILLGPLIFILGVSLLLVISTVHRMKLEEEHREELSRRENRYRTLAEHFPHGILFLFDRDIRFLFVDGKELNVLGLNKDILIGKKFQEVSPKDICDIALPHARAVFEGKSGHYEITYQEQIYENRMVPVIRHNQEITEGICITQNITERKQAEKKRAQLEAQLRQSQKMEAIGTLAGGVAHDFNNMLSVIIGRADIALRQFDSSKPFYGNLKEIKNAAERSANLTQQLLAFARKQTVSPKVLNLNDTVEGMLKMMRRLIGENIELTWKPGRDIWSIKMDPSQIDQMLANLCINARDAITGVGNILIETDNCSIDEFYCSDHADFIPGEYVRLMMSDNGRGMDKETLTHIFDPFFTTKETGEGTGLGLATVYGIVKQNNGFINVYSEPNQGTTFKIYLPQYVGETEKNQSEASEGLIQYGHETVLLVEDEPSLLKLGKMILENLGYKVLTAGTPGEAIELAEKHAGKIDLLLTDVIMPEMNGRELANRLLSLYPHLKSLYMSGYTANVIAHHGVLDEGVHFLQKPFTPQSLAAKVREALKNDEYQDD